MEDHGSFDRPSRRTHYALSSILNPQPATPTRGFPPRQSSAAGNSSHVEVVDLTGSSPDSSRTATNRPATDASDSRTKDSRKRRRTPQEGESARQRPRTETNATPVIDLSDSEKSSSDDEEGGAEDAAEKLRQEELMKIHKEAKEKTKLSDFKCAVCLDDPTDLASTPCGHLFCDKCVRMALKANQPETAKFGHCPICRSRVNLNKITVMEIRLGVRRNNSKKESS